MCVCLCFPSVLCSPSSLSSQLINIICDAWAHKQLERSVWVWHTWLICSMKAWLPEAETHPWKEAGKEEEAGVSRRCEESRE